MKYLAVKDFKKFQHYSKRNPPWIKLYATVLTDLSFLQMPEAAQAQLMKLWVLASQFGHPLPNNPKLLAGKVGASGKFHLATIIASGFLVPCDDLASADAIAGASETLSDSLDESPRDASASVPADARSRQSSERELETTNSSLHGDPDSAVRRELQRNSDTAIADLAALLTEVPGADDALTGFMEGLPAGQKRLTWARSLAASLAPLHGGRAIKPAALVAAMADFNLTERARFPYTGAVFRAFADKAMRDLDAPNVTNAAPRSASNRLPDSTVDELARWAAETDAKEKVKEPV